MQTKSEAAESLGVARKDIAQLTDAGLLDYAWVGKRMALSDEGVAALSARPELSPAHPAALIIRVAAKHPAETWDVERKWAGYSKTPYDPAFTPEQDEVVRKDALRGWWFVSAPETWVGGLAVVTLCTFEVATYRILGFEKGFYGTGRVRFDVEDADAEAQAVFKGTRITLGPGPVVVPLERDQPTKRSSRPDR